ncbi:MAG: hypothetical protein IJC34_01395, partial [Lentisphaeria bacterium]|nr:hypothetical protein [Lentisphaeria bacterium]
MTVFSIQCSGLPGTWSLRGWLQRACRTLNRKNPEKSHAGLLIFLLRRLPRAGSTRWHVTAPPLRFSAGGSRGRKPDSRPFRSGTMPPLT